MPSGVALAIAGVLLIGTVVGTAVAAHESSVAGAWRRDYQRTSRSLTGARASISQLDGQVASLDTQLAAQASAKEKALDQDTLLSQLVSKEGTVSSELNTCITDLQTLINTVATDLGSGYYGDPNVSAESSTASSDCDQAQSANDALQAQLNGATG